MEDICSIYEKHSTQYLLRIRCLKQRVTYFHTSTFRIHCRNKALRVALHTHTHYQKLFQTICVFRSTVGVVMLSPTRERLDPDQVRSRRTGVECSRQYVAYFLARFWRHTSTLWMCDYAFIAKFGVAGRVLCTEHVVSRWAMSASLS